MKKMVEQFQCPGCACGRDTKCGKYNYDEVELRCVSHGLGTHLGIGNIIALGLPKGFNKPGFNQDGKAKSQMAIRLFKSGDSPKWDIFNIPVWAMARDGYLFVRTFAPRVDFSWVDVIENGTLNMVPNAINVADYCNGWE